MRRPPAFPAGDAGLVSTADDFLAFSRFLLAAGRAGGSPAAARGLGRRDDAGSPDSRPSAPAGGDPGPGPRLGLRRRGRARTTADGVPPGAYGWNGGLGTSWVADPHSGLTALLMTQTMFESPDPPAVHRAFWRALFRPSAPVRS